MGRGHSSNRRVITAGPSGSSNGITRISDWTTSSQPSSTRGKKVGCDIHVTVHINPMTHKCNGKTLPLHRKQQHLTTYTVLLRFESSSDVFSVFEESFLCLEFVILLTALTSANSSLKQRRLQTTSQEVFCMLQQDNKV